METIMMDIDKLIPADYNPRMDLQKGDEEYEKLKAVIAQFGFVQPIVFNKRNNVVVGGHQRLKVAKDLGYEKVPTMMVDLDDKDEKILNLALNKVGGTFDEEKLGTLLNELQGMGDINLDLTGFDIVEIEELTLAFGGDLPFTEYGGDDDDSDGSENGYTYTGEDGEEQSGTYENNGDDTERGYLIQYNIIFDDETQQEVWQSFLGKLKAEFNQDAFPTHASRIHAFLKREVFK